MRHRVAPLDISQDEIIRKEKFDLNKYPDFEKLTEEDKDSFKKLVKRFFVKAEFLFNYIKENNTSAKAIYEKIKLLQVNYNMLFLDEIRLLEGGNKEEDDPIFTFDRSSTENINISTGSLEYTSRIASIPGRAGLDLNLSVKYDSTEASPVEETFYSCSYYADYNYLEFEVYCSQFTRRTGGHYIDCIVFKVGTTETREKAEELVKQLVAMGVQRDSEGREFWYEGSAEIMGKKYNEEGRFGNHVYRNLAIDKNPQNPMEAMGTGWRLNFPRIKKVFIPFAYPCNYWILEDETVVQKGSRDIRLEFSYGSILGNDHYVYTNNTTSLSYYFDINGKLLCYTDISHTNKVTFDYITTGEDYQGKIIITDSTGKKVDVDYDKTKVIITLPDGNKNIFKMGMVKEQWQLLSKTNALNKTTTYDYWVYNKEFDFISQSVIKSRRCPKISTYSLLETITKHNGVKTKYTHGILGACIAAGTYGKVIALGRREEIVNSMSYNVRVYHHSDPNYTGYPVAWGTGSDYDEEAEIEKSDYVVTISEPNIPGKPDIKHTFNHKHSLLSKETSDGKLKEYYSYNLIYNKYPRLIFKATANISNGTVKYLSEAWNYNEFNNTNIADIYDPYHNNVPGFSIPKKSVSDEAVSYGYFFKGIRLGKSYKKDANTQVREAHTIGSSQGYCTGIVKTVISENNIIKKQIDYELDEYGNAVLAKEQVDGKTINTYFSYNNGAELLSITKGNQTISFEYDIMGRKISSTDGNGNKTLISYDAIGRVLKTTHPDGSFIQNTYDDDNNILYTTNELGLKTKTYFDKLGRLSEVYDETNKVSIKKCFYDGNSRLIKEINSRGVEIDYTYDEKDRILSKKMSNYEEAYSYDDAFTKITGRYTKSIIGDGASETITSVYYTDEKGLTVSAGKIINSEEILEMYTYDYLGNQISKTSPLAQRSLFFYDVFKNLIKTINPDGSVYEENYDCLGRKLSSKDGNENIAYYFYDDLGNVIKEELPFDGTAKTIKEYTYDNNNNRIFESITTNLPGSLETKTTSTYSYNNRNLPEKVSVSDGITIKELSSYKYNFAGEIVETVTGDGAQRALNEYNEKGLLVRKTDYAGKEELYFYDTEGNLTEKIDRKGNVLVTTYDHLNRPTLIKTKDKNGREHPEYCYYEYSKTGLKTLEKNENFETIYNYDSGARVSRKLEKSENILTESLYSYDHNDNRKSFILKNKEITQLNTSYNYDSMNRLLSVLENDITQVSYNYDKNGNRKTISYSNGISGYYSYNNANLVSALSYYKSDYSLLSWEFYIYSLDGNLVYKKDDIEKKSSYYAYDFMGRLSVSEDKDLLKNEFNSLKIYEYDAFGNRIRIKEQDFLTDTIIQKKYEYNISNQLLKESITGTETEEKTYVYDENGNQITETNKDGVTTNTYDSLNRLISYSSPKTTIMYKYKSDNLRISKEEAGDKTLHLWDGNKMVSEVKVDKNKFITYLRGTSLIKNNNNEYFILNPRGDVTKVLDENEVTLENYYYDAFGNEYAPTNQCALKSSFRYTGKYFDLSSGIDMSYFKNFENVEKKLIAKPGKSVLEEVFEIKKADPYSVVLTNELNLTRNETYVLEFDYWSDLEGLTLFTDLGTIGTSIKTMITKSRVQRAKMELCYDSPNMLSSYLRFYSHNEGSIYVSNIRMYHKETAATENYLLENNILVETEDFVWLHNVLKGDVLRPGTWSPVEGLTIQKVSPYSVTNTHLLNLKENTDYVLEFECWADIDGTSLFTDLGTVTPPYQLVIVNKEVQKARITFNYDDPNLTDIRVRFYTHDEGNVYVTNIVMYEKQRLGEQSKDDYNPWRYTGKYFDLSSGIGMSHFKKFENVEKKLIAKPGKTVLEEVFEIKKADPYSVVLTNELNLSRNKTYVLEFDYWADLEGLTLFTDLLTTTTSIKTVFTKRRVQRAKMELCYDSPNMLSSYLRFYSHNEGSIYISNIRLYHKGAAESSSYLSSKDILIQTRDFDTMENALKGPLLRPDTQLAVEGFTIQKASPYSLILTSAINLKPNTDYVIEFEYWADAEGLTLFTDLATVSPPYQIVIAKKEVQKAYIVFNYDDPNLMNMHVRFYSHNEGNIYVSNIIMYEKQRLGEQPTGEYNPFRYAGEYTDLETNTIYLRNRNYNPATGRFLTEDPIRAGSNWYIYCLNNPVMRVDPLGLDSYIYYDPDTHDYTGEYIPKWQQSIADQFYKGDTSKVHLISLASTSKETSEQIFSREWGTMSQDSSIQSVVFHGHGNDTHQSIKLSTNFRVTAGNRVSDIEAAFGGTAVNINTLTAIKADYFMLLSCDQAAGTLDYNGSNKGLSNFASDIVMGKHTINNSVIASDGQGYSGRDGSRGSYGNGYRSFVWNSGTGGVDSFYMGHEFNSISDLIKTQIAGSKNPSLYQTPTNVPSISNKKKKP